MSNNFENAAVALSISRCTCYLYNLVPLSIHGGYSTDASKRFVSTLWELARCGIRCQLPCFPIDVICQSSSHEWLGFLLASVFYHRTNLHLTFAKCNCYKCAEKKETYTSYVVTLRTSKSVTFQRLN